MHVLARISLAAVLAAALAACSNESATDDAAAASAPAPAAEPAVSGRAEAIRTSTASIDGARIVKAEAGNWLSNGRTYDEQRHSPLNAINTETIGDLGLAW